MASLDLHRESLLVTAASGALDRPIRMGRYVLYAVLGQGGTATTFLALDRKQGSLCAIKRLHTHLCEDQAALNAFKDEADLARRLDHPGVAKVFDYGAVARRPYIAMELLVGLTLEALWTPEQARRLTPAQAAQIVSRALAVLDYAHGATDEGGHPLDLVHRDISPHNIFVCSTGRIVVLDFGIARHRQRSSHTTIGVVKGKLAYIAPEQAQASKLDARADIWSAGVVFWELLAHRRLFEAESEFATLTASLLADVPPLKEVAPQAPAELAQVVDRALQRVPSQRFPNARAMAEPIDAWLSEHGNQDHVEQLMSRIPADALMPSQRMLDRIERLEPVPTLPPGQRATRSKAVAIALATAATASWAIWGSSRGAPTPPALADTSHTLPSIAPNAEGAARMVEARDLDPPSDHVTEGPNPTRGDEITSVPGTAMPANAARPVSVAHLPVPAASGQQRRAEPPRAARPTRATSASEPAIATGRLSLFSKPWALVSLDGRRLGSTPLVNYELSAGKHTLELHSPAEGLKKTVHVVIEPDATAAKRVDLRAP